MWKVLGLSTEFVNCAYQSTKYLFKCYLLNQVCFNSDFELLLQNKYAGHNTIAFQVDSCCCTSWGTSAVVLS